jgi:lipoprotein-releasing system permease protein
MTAELHLARRYLLGLRRRTHVATVTLISLVGLALGVMALIVTLALLEGFQSSIRAELVERTAHGRVVPASGRRLTDVEALASVLHRQLPDVERIQVVHGTCLVRSMTDAVPALVVGRSDVSRVAVDQVLAARTVVGRGDLLEIVSPRQRLTPMGPVPLRARVEVDGVEPPRPGQETGSIRMPLADAQRLLWGEPVVEAIELRDPEDPWRVGDRARAALAGSGLDVDVEGLESLHRPLLLALALERVMIFLAVGLMLIVAALNLLCNVAMVAAEKRLDLAVLAGLGMPPAALRRLFLMLGLGIGLAGSLIGAVAGTGLAVALDRTGAFPLPRGVFMAASVPFRVEPGTVVLVTLLALALAALASWFPSRVVARREPAEGLRYE